MKPFKHLIGLLVTLLLLFGAVASAELSGVDAALQPWLSQEDALRFSMTLQPDVLLPFEKEALASMRKLLSHTSFQAALEQDETGGMTSLSLLVDDQTLMSLTEREQEGVFALETSLLRNRVLESSAASPIALLGRGEEETPGQPSFDMLTAFSETDASYKALVDACEPFAEKKRANYRIKDIGVSKWSQIARLSTEQSDAMLPLLRAVLKAGMDETHRQEMDGVRFGKGFIVGLYKESETGRDLALYMKGDLLYPDETTRKLAYQWAFVNNGTDRKDSYKYEIVKSGKPASSRVISALVSQKVLSDQLLLKGSGEAVFKGDGTSLEVTQRLNLTGKTQDGDRTLTGTLTEQTRTGLAEDAVTEILTLTPDLRIHPQDSDAILRGTVTVEQKKGKTVQSALTLTFADELPSDFSAGADGGMYAVAEAVEEEAVAEAPPPDSSLTQNEDLSPEADGSGDYLVKGAPQGLKTYVVPAQLTKVSLDGISPERLADLTGEMAQNLASQLLKAYAKLPEEDAAFLRDGLTDEDAARFLSLFGM